MNAQEMVSLGSLKPGQTAVVSSLRVDGLLCRRLLDSGFVEGVAVTCVMASPSGDPVVYRVRGTNIALRKPDADMVYVRGGAKEPDARSFHGCFGHGSCMTARVDCPAESGAKERVVALAGNPNTGKSTIFNALTGLRQHVGNWPGKTVARAEGRFPHDDETYRLVDLPGVYSLISCSIEEEIARDFIVFGQPDCTVIVADATSLERNLNLVIQILQITGRAVVCVNLLDEARRKGMAVHVAALEERLGVPVVATEARRGKGLMELKRAIRGVASGAVATRPLRIEFDPELEEAVTELASMVETMLPDAPNPRWIALRLIDGGDTRLVEEVRNGTLADRAGRTGAASLEAGVAPDSQAPWTRRGSRRSGHR